ncbi:MAG TPA: hypothetical protein VG820_10875, partial [Fimbriimonadaceae bacterium]|nr:hypothetical protein [Fimbriimonadaceae bacterium]
PAFLEPLWTIRNTIFDMAQIPRQPSAFALTMMGRVRIFGDTPVRCAEDPSKGLLITWSGAPSIILASGFPLSVSGDGIESRPILGYTSVTSSVAGDDHTAVLALPPWVGKLPAFVIPPLYDEVTN